MKAKIIFDLPQESYEHLCAVHGSQLAGIVRELREYTRNKIKYGDLDDAYRAAWEDIRAHLHVLIQDLPMDLLE